MQSLANNPNSFQYKFKLEKMKKLGVKVYLAFSIRPQKCNATPICHRNKK